MIWYPTATYDRCVPRLIYAKDHSQPNNDIKVYAWWSLSADGGNPVAKYNLVKLTSIMGIRIRGRIRGTAYLIKNTSLKSSVK
jgi:hypothetical protein